MALLSALLHPFHSYTAAEDRREARHKVALAREEADRIRMRIQAARKNGDLHHPTEVSHLTAQLVDRLRDLTYWADMARRPLS